MSENASKNDFVQRLYFADSPIRGHWVQITDVMRDVNVRRSYPPRVSEHLAQLLAAVALIADGVKWPGSISLQIKLPGPVRILQSEHRRDPDSDTGLLRAIARLQPQADTDDATQDTPAIDLPMEQPLLDGQLALSLLPDPDDPHANPYQGLIEVTSAGLAANLDSYFVNSEQIPTRFLLAANATSAAGLLLQRLPDDNPEDELRSTAANALWRALGERLDTAQSAAHSQQMLRAASSGTYADWLSDLCSDLGRSLELRLAPPRALAFACTCNRDKTAKVLAALGREELVELFTEQPTVEVTCEFCGQSYPYTAADAPLLDIH